MVPISMVYCMGVKSFYKDCRRCCRRRPKTADPEEVDSAQTYMGQENWTIGPASKRALASPKRIGKRQSQLQAEKEKIKKANAEFHLSENGDLKSQEQNSNAIDVNKTNGEVVKNGSGVSLHSKGGEGSLPGVESPSHIELQSNRSRSTSSRVENELDSQQSNSDKTSKSKEEAFTNNDNSKEKMSDERNSLKDENNESSSVVEDSSDDASSNSGDIADDTSVPGPPTYEEATNQAFVADNEESR